jgi:hypothetical protein
VLLLDFSSNEVSSLQIAQSVSGELSDLVELMYPQSQSMIPVKVEKMEYLMLELK